MISNKKLLEIQEEFEKIGTDFEVEKYTGGSDCYDDGFVHVDRNGLHLSCWIGENRSYENGARIADRLSKKVDKILSK